MLDAAEGRLWRVLLLRGGGRCRDNAGLRKATWQASLADVQQVAPRRGAAGGGRLLADRVAHVVHVWCRLSVHGSPRCGD